MATLTIAEYVNATANGTVMEPAAVIQAAVSTDSASASSALFANGTRFVKISAVGGSIHYRFGTSPTATTACPLLAAGAPIVVAVPPDGTLKVAGLTAS